MFVRFLWWWMRWQARFHALQFPTRVHTWDKASHLTELIGTKVKVRHKNKCKEKSGGAVAAWVH